MRQFVILLLIVGMCVSLSACTKRVKKDPRQLTALVSIEGSDTMTALVKAWAANFMKVDPDVPISVNSGNSGGGIDALINRTTDLAAASRDLNATESIQLHAKSIKLKKITVARDSIAIVVNPQNPVDSLTLEQLKNIFSGSITNWSAVGGNKAPIEVFSREEKSGTSNFFREHLLQGAEYLKHSQTVLSGNDLLAAIEHNKRAIGYVGMGTASTVADKVKVIGLKLSANSIPVKPTEISTTADYPLSRPLILFMDEEPKPSVRKFVDYCLGAEAQKLVREAGYAPVEQKVN